MDSGKRAAWDCLKRDEGSRVQCWVPMDNCFLFTSEQGLDIQNLPLQGNFDSSLVLFGAG